MGLEKLSLAALCNLDGGRIALAFEQELRRAEQDCRDRPGVDSSRKVTLTVNVMPEQDEDGDLSSVNVQCDIKGVIPTRKSKSYNMAATHGGLFFNEMSPEDVDQATLEFTQPRGLDEVEPTEDEEEQDARGVS